MLRGNLEIGSSQIDVCAQGKLIKVFNSCGLYAASCSGWHTQTKTLFPSDSGHFPEKRAAIMRKSPSPPAIRKQSQNWGNQIRFNKVIIYNWVPLKKKTACTVGEGERRAWLQQHGRYLRLWPHFGQRKSSIIHLCGLQEVCLDHDPLS